jgi:antitoxin (DNA-binding transcriptional repressor) of toxin-antitoxin stability system
MKAVGIRELKARLSHYLREVQAGEIVLVTDRGEVVAELRQPGGLPVAESPEERAVRALVARGGLLLGEALAPDTYAPSPLGFDDGTGASLLDEEREES